MAYSETITILKEEITMKFKAKFHYVYPESPEYKKIFETLVSCYGRFLEHDLIEAHNLMAKLTDEADFYNAVNSKWDFNAHTDAEYRKYVASELRQQIMPKINKAGISHALTFDVDEEDTCIIGYLHKGDERTSCYMYFTLKEVK
jgi:hypothetical protein